MDICTTSQFLCSLTYPQSRLRTQHNIICDPETFLCDKHIAMIEGSINVQSYLFYAPITSNGATMVRKALECSMDSDYFDLTILEDEIIYSGLGSGSCPLVMERLPDGIRLNEAIYTYSKSKLLKGFRAFKSRLKKLNISHNNLTLSNIIVDMDYVWYSICNYGITEGWGNDTESLTNIEQCINEYSISDTPNANTLEQQRLHSITTDSEGNVIYPIVESCRRFTSKNGVGFKDKYGNVIIADEFLSASDFSCNRSVVQLKNGKMGVIDRKGRYIIEPQYSSIVYNPTDGISIIHDGELETSFNYLGEQLEDWHK